MSIFSDCQFNLEWALDHDDYTLEHYGNEYTLKKNNATVFLAVVRDGALRTIHHNGQVLLYSYIRDCIDDDKKRHFIDLLKNFNREKKLSSRDKTQQEFESDAKAFEHAVVDAKKAGTLRVIERHEESDSQHRRMFGNIFGSGPYTEYIVKINGVQIGSCTNGEISTQFLRSMEYKGRHYNESEYPYEPCNFDCFWYSMLIVQMKHWREN